jgi:ketosteroid isomerase-like protein
MTTTQVMTTQEIASRLVELCREGKYDQAQDELFSQDAKSVEPPQAPGMQTAEGMDAIKKKGEVFQSMVEEMHGGYVTDPIVAGNHISVGLGIDATMKDMGRTKMDEIVVYEVKDGKIVKEQFFY